MTDYPRQLRQNNDDRWDFLAGLLPHGINPTDVDLMYERRGHFLVLEGKRTGASVRLGQRRFLDALARLRPWFFVIHFYGTPPDQVDAFGVWPSPASPGTTEDLRIRIQSWFDWVEKSAARRAS